MNTLIATLGASWQVIPEIVALIQPAACPLYQNHPQQHKLAELQHQCGHPNNQSSQLWIITSSSERTAQGIQRIKDWNQRLPQPLPITFFIAENTDDVTTEQELKALQELVFRVVLKASELGSVICSLAGGRKTMSADLQHAASLFGAQGLLHVVAPEPLPDELKSNQPDFWAKPLPAASAATLLPAYIGAYKRQETLDIDPAIQSTDYPLPAANIHQQVYFEYRPEQPQLVQQVMQREQAAGTLLNNYLADLAQQETHENWRHLYRLPPKTIQRLKTEKVGQQHLSLIQQMPKAELHCHLGGIPNLQQQIQIGHSIWQTLPHNQQQNLIQQLQPLLESETWLWDWPERYLRVEANPVYRAERAACLLTQNSPEKLQANLYQITEPRLALKNTPHGFSAYERPGELTGSSVLGHPAALKPYVQAILDYCKQDNLVYLELRGSPQKYRPENPQGWLLNFYQQLISHLPDDKIQIRFIWILDRRSTVELLARQVKQAVATHQHPQLNHFLVGLDLAGDESQNQPEQLAPHFLPAFASCLPLTIHAGEGQPAENIWQATYHLHADRVGHGLTLANHSALLTRFRNKKICLELCPTSNLEVIGYQPPEDHPAAADGQNLPHYPVAALWGSGIAITLNTDNPGISRTSLTQEYLLAAQLWETPQGMSLWNALAINKQAFIHAMASAEDREKMLKHWDKIIYQQMAEYFAESI